MNIATAQRNWETSTLARYEAAMEAHDRREAARDRAIEAEVARLRSLTVGELVDTHGLFHARLLDLANVPSTDLSRTVMGFDLEAIVRELATQAVEYQATAIAEAYSMGELQ